MIRFSSVCLFFVAFKQTLEAVKNAPPMPLDESNTCAYLLSGGAKFIFRATTKKMDGETVYQGYDPVTCEPKRRYLYRWQHNGKPEWNLDYNFNASIYDRVGIVEGGWSGCDTSEKSVWIWGQGIESKLTHYTDRACDATTATTTNTTTATKTPMDFKVYDVDTNNSCKYYERFPDGEEFVYYPTTDTHSGQTLYQAYDVKTCLPVHKALGYSFGSKRMIMSTETGTNTIVGMVNKWTGCARFVDRPVIGATSSTLSHFSSPFCPTIPKLQVDKSNHCSYLEDYDHGKHFYRPTTSRREGEVVYQAYRGGQGCDPVDRYMYLYKGQWVIDNNLFPFDGLATSADFNLGIWTGCNKNMYLRSSISMKYWGGPGCDPDWLQAHPIVESEDYCYLYLESDNTGGKEYVFFATIQHAGSSGAPVYQGYDRSTCEPLSLYLYEAGDGWIYGSDFGGTEGMIGAINSTLATCDVAMNPVPVMVKGKEFGFIQAHRSREKYCVPEELWH